MLGRVPVLWIWNNLWRVTARLSPSYAYRWHIYLICTNSICKTKRAGIIICLGGFLKLRKTWKIILTSGKAEQNVVFSQRTWLNLLKYEKLHLGIPYRNVIRLEMIYTTWTCEFILSPLPFKFVFASSLEIFREIIRDVHLTSGTTGRSTVSCVPLESRFMYYLSIARSPTTTPISCSSTNLFAPAVFHLLVLTCLQEVSDNFIVYSFKLIHFMQ